MEKSLTEVQAVIFRITWLIINIQIKSNQIKYFSVQEDAK